MKRRGFLQSIVVAVGPVISCRSTDDTLQDRDDTGAGDAGSKDTSADVFPQSVASGDPTPTSVVLWTRAVDPEEAPLELELEVSLDEDFSELVSFDDRTALALVADPRWDHCVRVEVEGLSPDTTYYYRFSTTGSRITRSRVGRTRTAPQEDSDRSVRFAVMSCQDYGGKYYHAQRFAAEQDLDFFVHLGDYVYETASNPDFQDVESERRVVFGDPDGALELSRTTLDENGEAVMAQEGFLAARSLDNYRDLYRTVRSDRDLQRLHERFPMIAVWDDHEFSDDCYGEHSTYAGELGDVRDPERRANADQAWFEYMPVRYIAGRDFEFDREHAFPDNLEIYREFRFGKHVHLVMTDLRRFRSDHVIDEEAFPGRVAVGEPRLLELFGELPALAEPYVDLDTHAEGALRAQLLEAVASGWEPGFDPSELTGELHAGFLNELIERHDQEFPDAPLTAVELDESLPRGIAYLQLGKTEAPSSLGARLFVAQEAFRIIARDRYEASGGESEQVMGSAQEAWFLDTLRGSEATWKIWGNSFTLATRKLDLSSLVLPDPRRAQELQLSADDWDGFPNRREALLEALSEVENLVSVTGDSHSFFASDVGVPGGERVLEFVCGALSSSTYRSVLDSGAGAGFGVSALAPLAGALIAQANPHIAHQNVSDNGFGVVTASAGELRVSFFELPYRSVAEPRLDGALAEHFREQAFRVRAGSARIEQRRDGEFQAWDRERGEWTRP